MTELYLIRHALSESNLKGVYDGDLEVALCDQGLKQLLYLPDYFKNIKLSAVYTSPIGRARITAKAIADKKGLEPIACKELKERYVGPYAGLTLEEIRNNKAIAPIVGKFVARPTLAGMESPGEVQQRMVKAIEEIVSKHKDEAVAIVSHGFAIQMYMAYALRISLEDYEKNTIKNASVNKVNYNKPGIPQVMSINEMYHLPKDLRF